MTDLLSAILSCKPRQRYFLRRVQPICLVIKMKLILFFFLFTSCKDNDAKMGDQCPNPTIYDFSFKVINKDSMDLIFDDKSFDVKEILFYPENERSRRLTFSSHEVNGIPFLSVNRFKRYDFYTLELSETVQIRLSFDLLLGTDPKNSLCKNYFPQKIYMDNSTLICNNCQERNFNYILIK